MIDLSIDIDVARQILTGFIQSEVSRVGFSRVVVGLSGGLDSAPEMRHGAGFSLSIDVRTKKTPGPSKK